MELNKDCTGIQECFHSVVEKYGREIFLCIYHSNMAGKAMEMLAEQAQKRQSRTIAHAAGVMGTSYNTVVELLGMKYGWTAELLAQVDRDSQLAWAASVQEAETPKIWLQ